MEGKYKWDNPHDWLMEKVNTWTENELRAELRHLATLLDGDQIQEAFESEMDKDGYFNKEV